MCFRTTSQITIMEKITFHFDNPKDVVRVRYRLRNGRKVQISYASDIECRLADLERLNPDGTTKSRISNYNRELSAALKKEYEIMTTAYEKMVREGMDLTSAVWKREIEAIKNPITVTRTDNPDIVTRFRKYADGVHRAGVIGANRYKHIIVVSDKLERFLRISGFSGITAEEFDVDRLMDFREFIFDEYLYVEKHKKLYENVSRQNRPTARLSMNTVTSQLKMFQTFFTELENLEEISRSPFRKLGRERKKSVMKTKYDAPIFLRKEEFQRILKNDAPISLRDTRDAFLVQCAFGCRVGDFKDLQEAKIFVTEEGIPYVHYIPKKTADAQNDNKEIETPIVRFAFDIIKRTGFVFPAVKNVDGNMGYNTRIKSLLQYYKIDRLVAQYNEDTKENEYIELYKVGSSKLARKTHIDLMNKVQIYSNAAGLHKDGSSSIKRYTDLEIKDRFALMNAAFDQKPFIVNNNLEII